MIWRKVICLSVGKGGNIYPPTQEFKNGKINSIKAEIR